LKNSLIKFARKMLAAGVIPGVHYAVLRLIWWISFKTKAYDASQPRVTIVMPVYNVEKYLADCIRSARAQRHGNFEIIAVNDGSTDSSAQILEKFAASTPELFIVTQDNQGLGAARNAGLDAIENTEFVMFLDSDDLLPMGAIERFVAQAQKTAADLVAGKTVCFYGSRYFDRTSTAALYKSDREQVSVNDVPEILGDATSWNKLYRYEFWQNTKLRYPVGVSYEDMTLVGRAGLFLARSSRGGVAVKAHCGTQESSGSTAFDRANQPYSASSNRQGFDWFCRARYLADQNHFARPTAFRTSDRTGRSGLLRRVQGSCLSGLGRGGCFGLGGLDR
jgi:hypothetical protein